MLSMQLMVFNYMCQPVLATNNTSEIINTASSNILLRCPSINFFLFVLLMVVVFFLKIDYLCIHIVGVFLHYCSCLCILCPTM